MSFDFIKSTRFWKLILVGIAGVLYAEGIITQAVLALIQTILLGSVVIRTCDRFAEKIGNK